MILETLSSHIADRLFVYQLLATLTTFSVINLILFVRTRKKRYQLFKQYNIPGPEPSLIDGNLHLYRSVAARHMVDEELCRKYGKYYGVFIGDEPELFITDLEMLRQIFLERMSSFKERSTVFLESTLTEGLLYARHDRWKQMRKIMSPTFSSYAIRDAKSTQFVEDSVKLMMDYIEKRTDIRNENNSKGSNECIDIHDLMKATALHMISSMAIGLPDVQVKEGQNYVKSLDSFLKMSGGGILVLAIKFPFLKRILNFLSVNFEHNATMALIHRVLNSNIDNEFKNLAKNKGQPEGKQNLLIHTMIKLHYEGKMTRTELIGNAEAILFAGYDTTSTTLSYIFWVLGKYSEIQEKLRSELMAHGTGSKYLEQIICEVMRLYPTVTSFTRRLATETIEVDGLVIPSGTNVIYNAWLMHRNADLWPEPEKFDPERFCEGLDNIHPCAYAPFGLGERKCLGYQLAKLEIKVITCEILMHYKLKTRAPEELELVSYANVLTKPKDKIMMELERI